MARHRKRFYAWRVGDREGVTTSWPECEGIVHGQNARYKGFATREEAEAWLQAGARYGPWDDGVTSPWLDRVEARKVRAAARPSASSPRGRKPRRERDPSRPGAFPDTPGIEGPLPREAIYFDSGTGRGNGVEVNVTTWDREPLAHLVVPEGRITRFRTVQLSPGRTNNYGELLACVLALRVARRLGLRMVCGDSRVVLDHWSRGHVRSDLVSNDPDFARLVQMATSERSAFEAEGGVLRHVPGDRNPADLGFHSPH